MRHLVASAVLAGSLLAGGRAAAQNADPYFHGDDAALASGSVVASGRDSGSFWYNPAGFGGLKRGLVNASASTFGIRVRRVPNALALRVGDRATQQAMPSLDVISVPNAVVAAMQLGDRFAIAGGLLTTQRDLRSSFAESEEEPRTTLSGAPLLAASRADIQLDTSKYHFGAAFAAELARNLRVGAALYGTYMKWSMTTQSGTSMRNATGFGSFGIDSARLTQTSFGITGSLGAQYDVSKAVSLGLTVRAPELALSQSSEGGAVSVTSASGGRGDPQSTLDRVEFVSGRQRGIIVAPTRLLFGVAYALGPPQSFLEAGIDFAHGLPATETTWAQQPVVNARVGVRYMLSPSWIVGGGLFTDRATNRDVNLPIVGGKVDWYGLTAGISKRTPLSLAEQPSPEALVLVTTLSLRAGLGTGTERGIMYDLEIGETPPGRPDVTYFELMPYLGSAVLF